MNKHAHLSFSQPITPAVVEKQERLLKIKQAHFHMDNSFQVMSSDDIAFLIGELYQLYFHSE